MMAMFARPWMAALLLTMIAACAAPREPVPPPADDRVVVEYVNPSRFAELRNQPRDSATERKAWMDELQRHLQQRAPAHLPAGSRLLVQFTDVELAGSYEPWRGPGLNNVRIVRDLYPPRLDLAFRLTGADGQVISQGRRELRDPAFLMRARSYPNDAQGYEKTMLDDWLRSEFGPRR